jgi:hypothetical protein
MTTETNTTKTKRVPAFYIFENIETDGQHERRLAGAAFAHSKGNGFLIIIDGQRFVSFPPEAKTEAPSADATSTEGESA